MAYVTPLSEFTEIALEQLRDEEGYRSKVYRDQLGFMSIGYGRNLSVRGITRKEAEAMLMRDFVHARDMLYRLQFFKRLDDVRKRVLIQMMFQLGNAGFLRFRKMIAALEEHDYEVAAAEMLDSRWAEQVKARAARLADRMRTGIES